MCACVEVRRVPGTHKEGNVGIGEESSHAEFVPARPSMGCGRFISPTKFWDAYRQTPAWEFQRFVELAERGKPRESPPRAANREETLQREREDLEASIRYTRKLLNL